jgi:N-acetylglucosaminyldiphosphoundecaprenol N-acetyl-beta-D-mannosaminyltransferase
MNLLNYANILCREKLDQIQAKRLLINTINAYSFVTAGRNESFHSSLLKSDLLLPDGISIVMAMRLLTGEKIKKIAGADLFEWEMNRLEKIKGKCFFLGSSDNTLTRIYERSKLEYPNVTVGYYSPPFKAAFSERENQLMIEAVNALSPDVLFVGMTAPKQEKWAAENFDNIHAQHVCCIGAVFDFFAGTHKRAPKWIINLGFEWFYRLVQEPRRMWKRYLLGNFEFIFQVFSEKIKRLLDGKKGISF